MAKKGKTLLISKPHLFFLSLFVSISPSSKRTDRLLRLGIPCIRSILFFQRLKFKIVAAARGVTADSDFSRSIARHHFNFNFVFPKFAGAVQLILVNNCPYSIWPGILGGAGHPSPQNGGFHLGVGEEFVFDVSYGWSGRIWARQGCCFDEQGKGTCDSGDCNGQLHCNGFGGTPPTTVVEMTFGTSKSPLHFYDVSLVDGFNIPVSMSPIGGGIGCGVAACEVNLNVCCPSKFEAKKHGKVVGCQSACMALNTDKYCCRGEYGLPSSCKPTLFSHLFKSICPNAYSFAYDDTLSLKSH